MTDTVLIIDFGSQVTQLIARRVREQGVYSEIVPFNKAEEALERLKPKAVILSGGPASVTEFGTPRAPDWVFKAGLPVLGICYGEQAMVAQLGGEVEGGHHREFGRAELDITADTPLFEGFWKKGERDTVWMSHGDRVTRLPPGFKVVGVSKGAPFAAIADEKRKLYAVQFHPEVAHTPRGGQLIGNFVRRIAGLPGDWTHGALQVERDRQDPRPGRQGPGDLRALRRRRQRGGRRADPRGDRRPAHLHLRRPRAACGSTRRRRSCTLFRGAFNIPLVHVDASAALPRRARRRDRPGGRSARPSARVFIEVFEEEAKKVGGAEFLAQGTLYPDVIESVSFTGGPSVTIKSHHNVGGLPERMNLKLIEPLRELFKDEVRALGRELGLPEHFIWRHPFPGPGLAVRIPGEVTRGAPRHPAQGRRHLPRRDPQGRPLRQDLAGVRRAAAGAHGGRDGRCADLRQRVRLARGDVDRRHDGGLLPLPARRAGRGGDADHQRGAGRQPRGVRRDEQAAGDD